MSKDLDKRIAELKKNSEELDKKIEEEKFKEENTQEKTVKVESEKPKPYKVFGCEFSVTEPHIVEYYRNRLEMMTIQYKLVGKFDEEGRYTIPKEIKYDLIQMQKEIEEMGVDFYKVSARYMKKYFNFTIKLTMLDDGQAKASLTLAEYVGKNVEDETIYTQVGDFVDVYDADYRIKLRKAFNLVDADAKNNDFAIQNLAVTMQDLIDTDIYIGGLYDMASQIYVIRMLKLLENGGEAEREILERYKKLVSQMEENQTEDENAQDPFKLKRKTNINEKYKELLDKAIDEKGGLEKLNIDKKEFKSCVEELNKTDKAISELSTASAGALDIEELGNLKTKNPENKGSSSSSSPAKKPATKKAGGGGGGAKKKPAKKSKGGKEQEKKKSGGGVVWKEEKQTPIFKPDNSNNDKKKPQENGSKNQPDKIFKIFRHGPQIDQNPYRQFHKRPPRHEEMEEEEVDELLDELLSEHEAKEGMENIETSQVGENFENPLVEVVKNPHEKDVFKEVLEENLHVPQMNKTEHPSKEIIKPENASQSNEGKEKYSEPVVKQEIDIEEFEME